MENILKIKKLSPDAKLPEYMTPGAAAMDIYACLNEAVTVMPGERALIPTGIAIALEAGYVALIFARSGLAVKQGLALANSVGVIDSDYRGEIGVGVINLGDKPVTIENSMRIAQMMVTPYTRVSLCECDTLEATERGEGGFGSTGAK